MSDDSRFIRTLRLRNFLSYGETSEAIECKPLNVLIGPNASGKSNLIEALGLLRATPGNLGDLIREGGGVSDWLWKGTTKTPVAEIDVTISPPSEIIPFRHRLNFTMVGQRFELVDEVIEAERPTRPGEADVYFYYRYQHGHPVVNERRVDEAETEGANGTKRRALKREQLEPNKSVLSQLKDPERYPELTYLGNQFSKFKLYREWNLGRRTPPRKPQNTDQPEDFLEEDALNLGLVLNDLQHRQDTKQVILKKLKLFNESFNDVTTKIHGGTVQIFLHENGLKHPIPATRLSDGTIRYLCLLAILCHPTPPPVVCIEEPELGLHPDVIPAIAELLIEASDRTQLFVTTHSDILVSALSHVPESVIVCEKSLGGSALRRLDQEQLKEWLKKYSLGELWLMGEIGGTAS